MAVIDYDVDIMGLGIPPLGPATDEPYQTGETNFPDRYDDLAEQRIIVMLDIMRAYLETLTSRQQLQRFHHAVSRVMGEVAYNRIYDDLGAETVSATIAVGSAGGETVGCETVDPDGTVNTTLAPAPLGVTSDLPTLVAAINGLGAPLGAANEVEAFAAPGGKLGFRLNAAGIAAGLTFTLSGDFIAKLGVPVGPHASAVRLAARRARDKGLEHFHREIRDDAL